MAELPVLAGSDLVLRPLGDADQSLYVALYSDSETMARAMPALDAAGALRAFRREVARAVDREVEDGGAFGLVEGGGGVHRPDSGGGVPLGGVEIEGVRRERAIGAWIGRFRGDAVGMMPCHAIAGNDAA